MLSWIKVRILVVVYDNKGWLTTDQITRRLSSNKRAIQYELTQLLNDFPGEINIESNRKYGYKLNSITDQIQREIIQVIEEKEMNYSMPERASLILLNILFSKSHTSITRISNDLFMSPTSIHNEMIVIKRWLNKLDGLDIEVGTHGIKVDGNEYFKRVACSIFGTTLSLDSIVSEDDKKRTYPLETIQTVLKKTLNHFNIKLTGQEFTLLSKFIHYGLLRVEMGFDEDIINLRDDADLHTSFAKKYFEILGVKNASMQINYLVEYLHGNVNVNYDQSHYKQINDSLELFESDLKKHFGVTLSIVEPKTMMQTHIINMINRINNDKRSVNYMDKRIIQTFPYEAHLAELYCDSYLKMPMPKAEVLFLALYMSQSIQRVKNYLRVLIVSNQTVSVINSLIDKIQGMIGETSDISFIPEYMKDDLIVSEYDLILTTEPKLIFSTPIMKLIPPILDNDNSSEVEEYLRLMIEERHLRAKQRVKSELIEEIQVESPEEIVIALQNQNAYYSENVTDNNTLLIIQQDQQYQNGIKCFNFIKGVEYKRRHINRVVVANVNYDRSVIFALFDVLSETLQRSHEY